LIFWNTVQLKAKSAQTSLGLLS